MNPLAMKIQAISDSVHAVTSALNAKITLSNQSLASVFRTSL